MISKVIFFFSPFRREEASVLGSLFISYVKWSNNEKTEFQSTLAYRSVHMDLFVEESLLYQSSLKYKKCKV